MKWIYIFFITAMMSAAQGSLVQREIIRGGRPYSDSDRLIVTGRTHYVEKNYVAAFNSYKKAIETLMQSTKQTTVFEIK